MSFYVEWTTRAASGHFPKGANMKTIIFVVMMAGVAGAGEYTYWDDSNGYHVREWTECRNGLPQPSGWYHWPALRYGVTESGIPWSQSGLTMTMGDSTELNYLAYIGQTNTNPPINKCLGAIGWWTWHVNFTGDTSGMSYWLRPGNLSMDFPGDPYNTSSPTDAADAAVMFLYWDTPVADITGDGLTDAADAAYLFAEWSGDSGPSSVPEPSGIYGLLAMLMPALLCRCRIAPSKLHLAERFQKDRASHR